jgi:hypothetical protein
MGPHDKVLLLRNSRFNAKSSHFMTSLSELLLNPTIALNPLLISRAREASIESIEKLVEL